MSRKDHFLDAAGLSIKGSLLFHGTSPENAESIMKSGFNLSAPETHGKASGHGVYLHHDPAEAAKYGDSMVVVRKTKGSLADSTEMALNTSHPFWRGDPNTPREEREAKFLKDYDYVGYKDPDDRSTIITDPTVLRPLAVANSGRCPTCQGNGFQPQTHKRCETCTGNGVTW